MTESQLREMLGINQTSPYIYDAQILKIFKFTQATLNNKAYRNDPLPTYLKLPGIRKRLWPVSEVAKWLTEQQESSTQKLLQLNPIIKK